MNFNYQNVSLREHSLGFRAFRFIVSGSFLGYTGKTPTFAITHTSKFGSYFKIKIWYHRLGYEFNINIIYGDGKKKLLNIYINSRTIQRRFYYFD